jgi:hypothetical protein
MTKPKLELYIKYHKDGSIYMKGSTINNTMEGYWEYFRKDGSIMRSGNFENGLQSGEWKTYSADGTIVKVTKFKSKINTPNISDEIRSYNNKLKDDNRDISNTLSSIIQSNLPNSTNYLWHGHPVWFIDGNPIVGYSKVKFGIRLLFWSGQSFEESNLQNSGSFKAAQIDYTNPNQIDINIIKRILKKSILIQWDYKNIVKRKGILERLK